MTQSGLPQMCYNPSLQGFEPYPHYVRMLADGMEAILDAYVYLHKRKEEKQNWLEFCIKTGDWLVRVQNEDGSFYRAYNTDGSYVWIPNQILPASSVFLCSCIW